MKTLDKFWVHRAYNEIELVGTSCARTVWITSFRRPHDWFPPAMRPLLLMGPDRSLDHLAPVFAGPLRLVLTDMAEWCAVHAPNLYVEQERVSEGFRTARYQRTLYAKGRQQVNGVWRVIHPSQVVTHRDGYDAPSNHQSGLAADVVPLLRSTGNYTWEPKDGFWDYLGHSARSHGLKWGGDWVSFKDMPHVEWPETDKATYQEARAWLKDQGLT